VSLAALAFEMATTIFTKGCRATGMTQNKHDTAQTGVRARFLAMAASQFPKFGL
jgi:hypothetical protein